MSVHFDDVKVFSETLEDHIAHLKAVFDRIIKTNAQSR